MNVISSARQDDGLLKHSRTHLGGKKKKGGLKKTLDDGGDIS